MKIYIGPYLNWWGPYQLVDLFLEPFGVSEDKRHELGTRLASTWVGTLCQKIHNKRRRKIKVRIDKYDHWSADSTLAIIILPVLQKLRYSLHGAPYTNDDDVPVFLRSTAVPPVGEYETDANFFKRWEWILDEMIWAFGQLQPECDWESAYHSRHPTDLVPAIFGKEGELEPRMTFDQEGYKAHSDRIDNGLRLFGVYYRGLWD